MVAIQSCAHVLMRVQGATEGIGSVQGLTSDHTLDGHRGGGDVWKWPKLFRAVQSCPKLPWVVQGSFTCVSNAGRLKMACGSMSAYTRAKGHAWHRRTDVHVSAPHHVSGHGGQHGLGAPQHVSGHGGQHGLGAPQHVSGHGGKHGVA